MSSVFTTDGLDAGIDASIGTVGNRPAFLFVEVVGSWASAVTVSGCSPQRTGDG
jgi:hypothetical protein